MAALSCLKNVGKYSRKVLLGCALASFKNASKSKAFQLNYVPIRMSHGNEHKIVIKNSQYPLAKAKDMIMFYITLGALPLIAIVAYVNIFIGPPELALIPEGYEPKHWEYQKHPITRFFARYLMPSPQEIYERNLHNLFILREIHEIKKLEKDIKNKMKERQDYQAWYFEKPVGKYSRRLVEDIRKQKFDDSSRGGNIIE